MSALNCIPGEDLHDGVTFERFLDAVGGHKRANILYDPSHMILQQMDYLGFLDVYHERVRAFHVKDAEYRPERALRRLWRLSGLDRSPRPLPFARRRADRLQRHLQQDGAVRLSRLGGAGVGVLPEAS
jgi:sugar phosphate isomerase/epimerase